jgi:UDP-N-acetylmuramate dehydrogenase
MVKNAIICYSTITLRRIIQVLPMNTIQSSLTIQPITNASSSALIDRLVPNANLSMYTYLNIGGSAQFLIEVFNAEELEFAVRFGVRQNLTITILGGGSNTLISDNGIEGLVIIHKSVKTIKTQPSVTNTSAEEPPKISHRHQSHGNELYRMDDLEYNDTGERVEITLDSGMPLSIAIAQTHQLGLTGFCHFAGIPGTLGGALYNNIHGGSKHLSEYIVAVEVLKIKDSQVIKKTLTNEELQFGYDESILRNETDSKYIILSITFSLYKGDVEKAKYYAQNFLKRKKEFQPWNSAGCVFKNLTSTQQANINSPTPSWGYVVDKVLGWKGKSVGGATISTLHASFIVNEHSATSNDVVQLMIEIKKEFIKKFGIVLEPEIKLLGFDANDQQIMFLLSSKQINPD